MKKSLPLRTIFIRSQVAISIGVLVVIAAILVSVSSVFISHLDQKNILRLAQSIESQAHIAKSPLYLQHATNNLVFSEHARSIVVFSKDYKIIASSSKPDPKNATQWLLADTEIHSLVSNAIKTGQFGFDFRSKSNRFITILPLGPAIDNGVRKNVIIGTRWSIPAWHSAAEIEPITPRLMLERLKGSLLQTNKQRFSLPSDLYQGVIVIESNKGWITTMALRAIILMALLMTTGLLIISFTLSKTVKRHVHNNINSFISVINQRKNGNTEVRVKKTGIDEFDKLATQWNSLLDYRQVAQSQNMVLSSLLEHVPVGIEVSDSNSCIEYANPAFLKITGLSLINVIGKTIDQVLDISKPNSSIIGDALVALSNGESWSGEITTTRPDESEMHCNITVVPIFGEKNTIERIVTLFHDITDIKDNQNQLVSAKVTAELADKAKSEFIANMSHELRTPLNAIIGFSELMAAEKIGPLGNKDYVEFSKLIENSSRSLLSTINTILELSRLDANVHNLDQQAIFPSRIIDKVINTKVDQARALGVEIYRDLSFNHLIHTDERLLRQSIAYLICNSIRYNNPNGGTVNVSSSLNENNQLVITVKDDGIGIKQDDIKEIMAPFHRVDNGLNRVNNGAGLGLTLVKKFSSAQDIDLSIESVIGVGTTATLTFASSDTREQKTMEQLGLNSEFDQAKSA